MSVPCRPITLASLPDRIPWISEEVHVYRANLETHSSLVNMLAATLSSEELDRANAYRHNDDARYFLMRRGYLRHLLSRYLAIPAKEVHLDYSARGKPRVAGEQNEIGLQFSMSYRCGAAVYACSCGRAVGIDIERMESSADLLGMAEQYFHSSETRFLRPRLKRGDFKSFYRVWVCKEAYIKARGIIPLDHFAIADAPDTSPTLVADLADPDQVSRWSFDWINAGPETCGAMVVEDKWSLAEAKC